MKKLISIIACAALAACTSPLTTPEGTFKPYGVANKDTRKSDRVCYEISFGNVIWSVLLIETAIAPIYFIGWDIYNPVRLKDANGKCV